METRIVDGDIDNAVENRYHIITLDRTTPAIQPVEMYQNRDICWWWDGLSSSLEASFEKREASAANRPDPNEYNRYWVLFWNELTICKSVFVEERVEIALVKWPRCQLLYYPNYTILNECILWNARMIFPLSNEQSTEQVQWGIERDFLAKTKNHSKMPSVVFSLRLEDDGSPGYHKRVTYWNLVL
jgi:hypothetical protein